MHVGFIELEKAYDKVNREALWHVLKMYDLSEKHLNGIKSVCVNSLACVGIIEGENECFRIESGLRQGCIMSLWLSVCIWMSY